MCVSLCLFGLVMDGHPVSSCFSPTEDPVAGYHPVGSSLPPLPMAPKALVSPVSAAAINPRTRPHSSRIPREEAKWGTRCETWHPAMHLLRLLLLKARRRQETLLACFLLLLAVFYFAACMCACLYACSSALLAAILRRGQKYFGALVQLTPST